MQVVEGAGVVDDGLWEYALMIRNIPSAQRGYHRCVAQRLKLHVAAGVIAFKFNDDERALPVDCKQVDSTLTILPLREFLSDNEQVIADRRDGMLKESLKIFSLPKCLLVKCRSLHWRK